MEMYLLYKPYGMMVLPDSKESYDFHGRWICTETEDDKEILCDLPDWCPLPASHSAAAEPVPDVTLTELSAINDRLLKLYPDDFALQLNTMQLQQQQEGHDEQIRQQERERVRERVLPSLQTTYDKFQCLDKLLSDVAGKCGEARTATMLEVAGEMWQVIKESLRAVQP